MNNQIFIRDTPSNRVQTFSLNNKEMQNTHWKSDKGYGTRLRYEYIGYTGAASFKLEDWMHRCNLNSTLEVLVPGLFLHIKCVGNCPPSGFECPRTEVGMLTLYIYGMPAYKLIWIQRFKS